MDEQTALDAMRLLRVANEFHAHDREGAQVELMNREATAAGLEFGSPHFNAALQALLVAGALVPNERFDEIASRTLGSEGIAFIMTRAGLEMLGVEPVE